MAVAVTNKALLLVDQTKTIWRLLSSSSFNFTKNYSVAAISHSSPATGVAVTATASKISKRKKKKNLFEVAQFLPNWGLEYHMAKTHWIGISYQITKINLYKDGRHGKAWGLVHKEGLPAAEAPKKYIANLAKTPSSISSHPPPQPHFQAA